jgi:H+/Cl- antiporter ClcA
VRADRLIDAGLTFAGNFFFPRLSYRLRWRTRLGPGGTLVYVLASTGFAVGFVWFVRKVAQGQDQLRAELREHLGREPTSDEVFEYLRRHEAS